MFYVYFLRCNDNTLYCGYTNNLEKRFLAHNTKKGARYTKSRTPLELVYFEEFKDRKDAMKREYCLKQLSRFEKEEIIKKNPYFV